MDRQNDTHCRVHVKNRRFIAGGAHVSRLDADPALRVWRAQLVRASCAARASEATASVVDGVSETIRCEALIAS
jgi:hypothetical protein